MTNPQESTDRRALLQNALAALETMQARLSAAEDRAREPIAVVGLGCRFPGGVDGPESYWRLLEQGVDAVRRMPAARWDARFGEAPFGGFLDRIDQFDAAFFGISPREAESMDPQQRLLLEVAWEALENAAQAPEGLRGSRTGVFVGITTTDYARLVLGRSPDRLDAYTATGNALNAAAGRPAYVLGLHGPCMAVDTACSSSLVALHLACQSLRLGESDRALAGGVNILVTPEPFICFQKWGMMAPDGRCKTFDAAADGFVRGEGCAVLMLRRLSDARAAGERILALIRGSAVGQDGASSGLTVPNGPAQQTVIREALQAAGVRPGQIGYVEAHGTGTALGDPIELEALAAVLASGRPATDPLRVGSVKTNLGHLESAAGLAGVIKVILALEREQIPPQLHFQTLSPNISLGGLPVEIPTALTPWPRAEAPRLAGVSGFGFSGTNAHVIFEEAPEESLGARTSSSASPTAEIAELDKRSHLLTISARTAPTLRALAERYVEFLGHSPADFAAIAHTSRVGRTHLTHRLAIVAASAGEARQRLESWLAGATPTQAPQGGLYQGARRADRPPRVAFLFTGQGAQYAGMARRLHETQPVFRAALERCAELLRPSLPKPLLALLFEADDEARLLDQTGCTQPALFALEFALCELWRAWGIEPAAVLGHSVGEFAAACAAGVFSLEDGLRLIAERARLMQALPATGAMAVVFAPLAQVETALAPYASTLSVAAVNGPESIVVSGERAALGELLAELERQGVQSRPLNVSHAFHSPLMEPMLDALEQAAAGAAAQPPRLPLISNLSGLAMDSAQAPEAAYWRRHAREAVRFADSIATLAAMELDGWLELGPDPVLVGMARRCRPEFAGPALASLRKGRDDRDQMLESLAQLYVIGARVNWGALDAGQPLPLAALPTYPFERTRHWIELEPRHAPAGQAFGAGSPSGHPLLGARLDLAGSPGTTLWQGPLDLNRLAWLLDHRVQGLAVLPATAYLELALEAATERLGERPLVLRDIVQERPLLLTADARPLLQLVLTEEADGSLAYRIYSRAGEARQAWTLHAHGRILTGDFAADGEAGSLATDEVRARITEELTGAEFYRRMAAAGNQWGPAFQGVEHLWRSPDEALGLIRIPEALPDEMAAWQFHPALADACGHPLSALIGALGGGFVGAGIEEVRLHRRPRGQRFWGHAHLRQATQADENVLYGDVCVYDESGALISETRGVRLQTLAEGAAPACAADAAEDLTPWLHELQWRPCELAPETPARPAGEGPWVILTDRQGVGEALAARLEGEGQPCLRVRHGESFEHHQDGIFEIHPAALEDMTRLFAELRERAVAGQPLCRGLIHLWSLDAPPMDALEHFSSQAPPPGNPEFTPRELFNSAYARRSATLPPSAATLFTPQGLFNSAQDRPSSCCDPVYPKGILQEARRTAGQDGSAARALEAAQALACLATLHLVQAVAGTAETPRPRLWLVTRGAQTGPGEADTPVALAQAPLWGLGRSPAAEHPELWGGLIDLDPAASPADSAALLARELHATDGEDQLLFRQNVRHGARLARREQPRVTARPFACRPDAAYLITGDLGGLGLLAAGWLAGRGARHLVLLGRTPLPPRAEWEAVEKNPQDSPMAEKIKALRALEAQGVTLRLAAVDVGDAGQLTHLFGDLRRENFPPVRGVMHLAGVLQYEPLLELDDEKMKRFLRPKVAGGWLLHELLADSPLDFFVLFSSASALMPTALMGGYCAANAFLDALAHWRRSQGRPALSVNWGVWGEAGMAASRYAGGRQSSGMQGVRPLDNRLGLRILEELLDRDEAQACVLSIDWTLWRRLYPDLMKSPLLAHLAGPEAAGSAPAAADERRPALSAAVLRATEPETRRQWLRDYLVREVAGVLGYGDAMIDPDQPIAGYGFDSLMAVQLRNRIETELGLAVPMVQFLEGTDVGRLADALEARLAATTPSPDEAGQAHETEIDRGSVAVMGADSDWEEGEL